MNSWTARLRSTSTCAISRANWSLSFGSLGPVIPPIWQRVGLVPITRDGDKLAVWKVDRLGRSTFDALSTSKELDTRGVRIVITTLGVDLKTPAGRLVFGVLAQIAEFERELIKERVTAGIAAARKRGVAFGRRHTLRPNQRLEAVRMHLEEGKSIGQIAALFGCGRTVVHRAIHCLAARVASGPVIPAFEPATDPLFRQAGLILE